MEERLHARKAVEFMVRLVRQGQIVGTVQALDMSRGGLGIERAEMVLNKGDSVGVVFFKPGYPRTISRYISSVVVHSGEKSIGLMLEHDLNS